MTATILRLVLDHWREGLIALGILAAAGYCHQRDARIAEEAAREALVEVHEQRMDSLVAEVESLEAERARADSQAVLDARRFAEMRREADSLRALAQAAADSASARVTEAGDSLAATLDSAWAVVIKAEAEGTLIPPETLKPLIATAQRQHTRERAAVRDMRGALKDQLAMTVKLREAADSTAELWRERHERLERVHEVQSRALAEARAAVGASGSDNGRLGRDVAVAASAVGGFVLIRDVLIPALR